MHNSWLRIYFRITQYIFASVAQEICKLFRKEPAAIYFREYKPKNNKSPHRPAGGKLWSRYINTKRNIKLIQETVPVVTDKEEGN